MGFIWWLVVGLIVGSLAKWVMPGRDPGGIIVTSLLGVAGALVGGAIASALGIGSFTGFNLGSLAIATAGAVLLLFAYRRLRAGAPTV
ncbi:MAG TPA: GlsB/YeaQ/YmgE family stress response membrane protein [Myxococcota bacterium]|jgi:uncharacterized membrane protein YeaQ/YmgE (transglycosylase-associated protein family)|nr:GlsB/YeaQ/YmgE family stress response membrane protein [Myxococcota bacterium]